MESAPANTPRPEPAFVGFPKISRLNRDVVVSEKIDGTNAQVWISDDGTEVRAGSRTRWITPQSDNFGFASWVETNKDEILKLGPGSHFGEWFGRGIQRGYGLQERRFSLFNVARWSDASTRPKCCGVVPTLWTGLMEDFFQYRGNDSVFDEIMDNLRTKGSVAVPGFLKPEGIVIFHTASSTLYKKTLEGDEKPKGAS